MTVSDALALLNALLNATAAALLITGYRRIRRKDRQGHRRAMLGALGVSAVFLVSYLTRVALAGTHRWPDDVPGKNLYLAMLASHVLLAALVPVFAVVGVRWALRGEFDKHRRLMRLGLPIWLYVSVTGVLIYLAITLALGGF